MIDLLRFSTYVPSKHLICKVWQLIPPSVLSKISFLLPNCINLARTSKITSCVSIHNHCRNKYFGFFWKKKHVTFRERVSVLQPSEVIRAGELPLLCWPLSRGIACVASEITKQLVPDLLNPDPTSYREVWSLQLNQLLQIKLVKNPVEVLTEKIDFFFFLVF